MENFINIYTLALGVTTYLPYMFNSGMAKYAIDYCLEYTSETKYDVEETSEETKSSD